MATPLVGHLDPQFLDLMEETKTLLRWLFRTRNELTIPISGTGSAGMEACLVNLLEEGDEAVIGVNGVFGSRMLDIAQRCGARAIAVEAPWGRIVDAADIAAALHRCKKPKVVAVVHAETSTGVWQPLDEIASLAREAGALFVVDAVTSLGGVPVEVDAWGIDACYSGTQKCLSCPPGLAPITFSERAMDAIHRRRTKVPSWYLDMTMIARYWGSERFYHHTAPISMIYALREALRLVHEEGLEARFARHRLHAGALAAGLTALGVPLAAEEGFRAPMLTLCAIPDGVDDLSVRKRLLSEFHIEIGGGLGIFKGKMWRIGLMGETAQRGNVITALDALEASLAAEGMRLRRGAAVAAATEYYATVGQA